MTATVTCAQCGRTFASVRSRGIHSRRAHPAAANRDREIVRDYVNGVALRTIKERHRVNDQTLGQAARAMGISPRRTGFANYETAHRWVLEARKEFERALTIAK